MIHLQSELPKGTHLDLSHNLLTWLPEDFGQLTHVTHLDLSKNQVTELPEYFGQLKNLKWLDLSNNLLTCLPVSFSQLKNLKWLDLKNNPLETNLSKAAGPCITPTDCSTCAKRVGKCWYFLVTGCNPGFARRNVCKI